MERGLSRSKVGMVIHVLITLIADIFLKMLVGLRKGFQHIPVALLCIIHEKHSTCNSMRLLYRVKFAMDAGPSAECVQKHRAQLTTYECHAALKNDDLYDTDELPIHVVETVPKADSLLFVILIFTWLRLHPVPVGLCWLALVLPLGVTVALVVCSSTS